MALPLPFQVGQKVVASACRVEARQTKPPDRYTDGTLIDDMVNVHKFVSDERQKAVLKRTKGLGTERTRADIIEKNIEDGLIVRDGKFLDASDLGIEMMAHIDDGLKDPGTTALWEAALANVEDGKTLPATFMSSIKQTVRKMIDKAYGKSFDGPHLEAKRAAGKAAPVQVEPLPGDGETCPKCGEGTMTTRYSGKTKRRFLSCNCYPKCKHIAS